MAVTILLINAKGLNSPFKRSMLCREAKTSKADIICAQETHFKASSLLRIHNRNFPHIFTACSETKKAGVLMAIKDSVIFNLQQTYVDPGGRFVILICDININLYIGQCICSKFA